MKKVLLLSLFVTVLAVFSLPFALGMADGEKEKIFITEEVLEGNPAEAAGITLKLPSHYGKRLLWNTEYTIGSGRDAESSFVFSSDSVAWKGPETEVTAGLSFAVRGAISSVYGEGYTPLDWDGDVYYEIIGDVAERTENGETHTEIIKIGDYHSNYPMYFGIEGHSVSYVDDYGNACRYLSDFFHISPAEDRIEITVEKRNQGDLRSVSARYIESEEYTSIFNIAADGGEGVYFAYGLVNEETGEWADRGQNRGIFYFPYQEEKSFWNVDLTQVRKLCDFPENVIPVQMQIDRDEGMLYLAVKEKEGYSLYIYHLEGEAPVLIQQIPEDRNAAYQAADDLEDKNDVYQEVIASETERLRQPYFRRMIVEDGGILMTWDDNSFSFWAEENGQYRWWCRGVFPENTEKAYGGNPFPKEQICIFDGERLFLAAYESWYSMNVLLSVYEEQSLLYSGRYVHSGEDDIDAGYDNRSKILPQGVRPNAAEYSMRMGGGNVFVKPLEMFMNGPKGNLDK